jgi:hypothetical protein
VKESTDSGSLPTYFERNDAWVIEAFRRGEFDYLEGVGEVSEADFFRAITERTILQKLADTYPSPCQKHDVPLWVYIASDISMRFHGVHPFHAFPYVVRSGGMIQAFGPEMGHKAIHPQTGDVSLRCEGFNAKNEYDRQTPCDQDYLRKMGRKTDAQLLQTWFHREGGVSLSNIMRSIPRGYLSGMPPIFLCLIIPATKAPRFCSLMNITIRWRGKS